MLGSYYDLSFDLGPPGNDELALRALRALWKHPSLRGPWLDPELSGEPAVPQESLRLDQSYYGTLVLEQGAELVCHSSFFRFEQEGEEADQLDFSIPTAALELVFPVCYPLENSTNPWLPALELELARVGARVYRDAKFRVALIGEEVGAYISAAHLTARNCERGGVLVPEMLWRSLAPRRQVDVWPPGIVYAPFVDDPQEVVTD